MDFVSLPMIIHLPLDAWSSTDISEVDSTPLGVDVTTSLFPGPTPHPDFCRLQYGKFFVHTRGEPGNEANLN